MSQVSLIVNFLKDIKEGKASDAQANLNKIIDLKIKNKHEKAKEID